MHKYFSSLRGTLLVIVVLGLACTVVTLMSVQHGQRQQENRAWAQALTTVIAASLQTPGDATPTELDRRVAEHMRSAPDWLRASLDTVRFVPAGQVPAAVEAMGFSRLATTADAPAAGGALVLGWSGSQLLAGTSDLGLQWALAAGLAALLSALVVVAMNQSVVRPLQILSAHFDRVAKGERAPVTEEGLLDRVDEIGQLTGAFNAMTSSLFRARRALERSLADIDEQNDVLNAALGNMVQGLCMFGPDGRLTIVNDRFRAMFPALDSVAPGAGYHELMASASLAEWMIDPSQSGVARLPDGRIIACNRRAFGDGGRVETFEDITEQRRAEAKIAHLAMHDGLTNLANRNKFRTELEGALGDLAGRELAILCIDLDHFKSINDTMGHPFADAVLRQAAERIGAVAGQDGTAARLGGDEFALIVTSEDATARANQLAGALIESLSRPFSVDGRHAAISASIGIAIAPADTADAEELVKCADLALYRAKNDGRACFRRYEPEMDSQVQERRMMELDLRNAISAGELELYYQPLVNIESQTISGFEALLRWNSPTRGQIPPSVFIPLAEQTGLITQIGAWVLKQGCVEAVRWPEHLRLAVNLSPIQFKSKTLALDVIAALGMSGLSPRRLELEITESVMLQETEATLNMLHSLRNLGVRISMDDFGTGYSSLSYLRQFPFDKIKIDQSFVRDLPTKNGSVAIVRAVTGLGVSLGITTTAEGVETVEQLEKLRNEGCIEIQGYLISPPRPASEIPGLVARYSGGGSIEERSIEKPEKPQLRAVGG